MHDKLLKNPLSFKHLLNCVFFNCRGLDFRTVLAMTTTASRTDMKCIQDSLGLKNCKYIVTNPDRKNICYKKIFRSGQDVDAIQSILVPIASALHEKKVDYPLTIVYIPLRLCGFAYKRFEHVLGMVSISLLAVLQFLLIGCLHSFMLHKPVK